MLQSKLAESAPVTPRDVVSVSPSPRALAELLDRVTRAVHGLGFIGGLNPAQWAALRHIGHAEAALCTVGGVAEAQGVTAPTSSETISALVRKGYVERLPSAGDKRSHLLALTTVGRSLLEVDPLRDLAAALDGLNDARRRALAGDLDTILVDVSQRRARRRQGS